MLENRCSGARDLSSEAAGDRRQLSEARVIGSEEVARLWDKRERIGSRRVARAAAVEKKERWTTKTSD